MRQSLTEKFVEEIEFKILKGDLKIGDRIPTLRELSETMKLSRSVINAGIVELINKGYLRSVPRQRIEVNNWKREGTLAVINGIMENNIFDESILRNLLESRMLIECECAALAAKNRTEEDLDNLKSIIKEEFTERSIDEMVKGDLLFHHSIAVASGNMVYTLMLKSFEHSTLRLIREFYSHSEVLNFVYGNHLRLFNAIKNKNPDESRNIMRELLEHGEKIIGAVIKGG